MSLVRLGSRSVRPDAPATLLVECHTRIRTFAELAVRLASEPADEAALRDAAARVHRYFTQALPLHVADEEQSLLPRLRRYAPEVEEALAVMERQHGEHDARLARLIPAWAELRDDPGERGRTLEDAARLRDELEVHLAAEERLVIPALTRLPIEEQRAFLEELRGRRR